MATTSTRTDSSGGAGMQVKTAETHGGHVMGLMDKVKAQATVLADKAQTGLQQGQTKIQEMQTGKQVDHLLRELGAYVFLSERDRTQPDSETKVAGIMTQLDALEASGNPVTVTPEGGVAPAGGSIPPTGAPAPGPVPQPGTTMPEGGGSIPTAGDNLPS